MDDPAPRLPETALAAMPLFPLPSTVLFPNTCLALNVFEPRYRDLVAYALDEGQGALAVPLLRPGFEAVYEGRPPVHPIMGAGVIVEHRRLPDGRYHILVRGTDRVRLVEELPPKRTFRVARVECVSDRPASSGGEARRLALEQLVLRLIEAVPDARSALSEILETRAADTCLASTLASSLIPDASLRQRLLEERDPSARFEAIEAAIAELLLRLDAGGPAHPN